MISHIVIQIKTHLLKWQGSPPALKCEKIKYVPRRRSSFSWSATGRSSSLSRLCGYAGVCRKLCRSEKLWQQLSAHFKSVWSLFLQQLVWLCSPWAPLFLHTPPGWQSNGSFPLYITAAQGHLKQMAYSKQTAKACTWHLQGTQVSY